MSRDELKQSAWSIVNYFMSNGPAWFLLAAVLYGGYQAIPEIFNRMDIIQSRQDAVIKELTTEIRHTNNTLGDAARKIRASHEAIEGTLNKLERIVGAASILQPREQAQKYEEQISP